MRIRKTMMLMFLTACIAVRACGGAGTATASPLSRDVLRVTCTPIQFLHIGSRRLVAVDLRNPSSGAAVVKLTTSLGTSRFTIPPRARQRVKLPVSMAETQLGCVITQGKAIRQSRISLAGTPDTVIPFGEREAPILDQLWALAPEWTMGGRSHFRGAQPWKPGSLSVKAQFQYDEAGLWMRFIVTDNVFEQGRRGRDFWQGDSVQVSIQPVEAKLAPRHSFGFWISPEGPRALRFAGPGAWTGMLDIVQRGHVTTYDARIAWPDLASLKPEPGMRFLMNFAVNDYDGGGRRTRMEWTAGAGQADDPSNWMEWTLGIPGPEPTSM